MKAYSFSIMASPANALINDIESKKNLVRDLLLKVDSVRPTQNLHVNYLWKPSRLASR